MIRFTITGNDVVRTPESETRRTLILEHLVNLSINGNVSDAVIEWGDTKGLMREEDSSEIDGDIRNGALDEAAAIVDAGRNGSSDLFDIRDQILKLKTPT